MNERFRIVGDRLHDAVVDVVRRPIVAYEEVLARRNIPSTTVRMVRLALDERGLSAGAETVYRQLGVRVKKQFEMIKATRGKEFSPSARRAISCGLGLIFVVSTPFEIAVRVAGGEAGERLLTYIYKNTPIVDWGTTAEVTISNRVKTALGVNEDVLVVGPYTSGPSKGMIRVIVGGISYEFESPRAKDGTLKEASDLDPEYIAGQVRAQNATATNAERETARIRARREEKKIYVLKLLAVKTKIFDF